jgi:hypothetical protein
MTEWSFLDEHRAYLGTSGSGKSTTARGHVEQLLHEGRHTCVTDHTGVWWGLRSNAAGTGPGFDIPIFGGRHGDVPISAEDGGAIGKIIGDGVSAIVDLSSLRTGYEQRVFMRDFVAALRAKPAGHFQFVADEADEDVPEKTRDSVHFELAEDMIWIAKRGRSDGFVLSLITQRTASIANEALAMAKTIFAHQLISPADTAAFGRYVRAHGTTAEHKEIMARLPSLQTGERYVYSPQRHVLELGRSPMPATFDSSRTPGPGETKREPKMLSEIDVGAIAPALKKPELDAPSGLADVAGGDGATAARIRALEGELETARGHGLAGDRELEQLRGRLKVYENLVVNVQLALDDAREELGLRGVAPVARIVSADMPREESINPSTPPRGPDVGGGEAHPAPRSAKLGQGGASPTPQREPAVTVSAELEGAALPEKEYRALGILASVFPLGLTEAAWAARAGYSRKGGAWSRRLTRYRRAELIEQRDGRFFATQAGLDQAGEEIPDTPPPGAQLVAFWAKRLGAPGRILLALAKIYPEDLKRDAIAGQVNMSAKGGAFTRAMTALKQAEVIQERRKRIRVAPHLMGDE